MSSPCWILKYCRPTLRPLFLNRPTRTMSLVQLSAECRGEEVLLKRSALFINLLRVKVKTDVGHVLCNLQKKRDRAAEGLSNGDSSCRSEASSATEDISVPKDLDLIALPQLCFPGGLQLDSEQKDDTYHFLVFTDLFGNRTHGVVVQYYRAVQ
ncbi:hypothetical protein GOODEAATRI_026471, partial [Goodea atripinnis]